MFAAILPLHAVPIARESFDSVGYSQGALLGGLNGGSGWNGAWTGGASTTISTAGMGYAKEASVLLASGGKLQCAGGSGSRLIATGAGSPAHAAGLVDASGRIGADGTSVWVAFLGQCITSGADFSIDFTRPGAPFPLPQTGVISLGAPRQWRFWPHANLAGIPATDKVLLVWRIDFTTTANDSCSLWINPTPGTLPSDASRDYHVSAWDWSFDRLSFSGGSATTLHFDELRVGTSYADVAPIDPSPPAVPGEPFPAPVASDVPTSTLLDWADVAGAASYDLYLWPASGAQPEAPTATPAASHYDPPGYLLPLTTYRWQVVSRNPFGTAGGPIWTFTTDNGHPPAPTSPSPAADATEVLVDAALAWADSPGAESYQIYLWPAGETRPATPVATVAAGTFLPPLPMLGNTSYNWQIVATNALGSAVGEVWSFTTGDRYPGYLVPWPKSVTMEESGDFTFTAGTRIVAEHALLLPLAQVMANDFLMATGLALASLQGTAQAGDIVLRIDPGLAGEAYTLDASGANIVLSGSNYQAVAWASVTLLQAVDTSGTPAKVPRMLIEDEPAAPLRTVMWDIARFFHPLENLYELVDLHRMYKVTYMHLFMSADGLFTFGSTAYPALARTNNGSVPYGGSAGFYLPAVGSRLYYTKAELAELVSYAEARGVVIVPEIDTPSWAAHMTTHLPEVFCSEGGVTRTHDININYPAAVTAMENILGELAAVFHTSPYIHIGADEVPASQFESYPNWAAASAANNYATGGEGLVWYMNRLNTKIASLGKSSWSWSAPGVVGKGYDMPATMVYTGWGHDDGQNASQGGYPVMRAAGGHVAGMGQATRGAPYNRCLLYRPAEGIYNRLTPLRRFISAPDAMYTDLEPAFLPLTGRENQIVGAHIMSWETPNEIEVPAMRLSMPALGEPTWNQEPTPRRNWANFMVRQKQTDRLYQRVMRPVSLSVTTQVAPGDSCFVAGGMVTMTSPVGGTIRYTVGTDYRNSWYNFPTPTSTAYSGPFPITQSSVISARLFDASGNPLGNPVTRGFNLITPRTHYRYFLTGSAPSPDFAQGSPIVSSVMGRMDGNAPHEDVRFGDTLHRTVYCGSIDTSAGSHTFNASFAGGAITIDRQPVANGTPVTLTAGEHIVSITTPASGLGTPYTFSGPGHGAGSDINLLLRTLDTASEVFPAAHAFGSRSIGSGAGAAMEITLINHDVFADMLVSGVELAGSDASDFVISGDSGETVLSPGAERVIELRFNPATGGSKTATLRVTADGLPGGHADVSLTGTAESTTLPSVPATPTPANVGTGVPVNPGLDWADSLGADSYDVFLWPASDAKPSLPNATVSMSLWTPPTGLTGGTNYLWQVVANNAEGSTAGDVWSFETTLSSVQVTNLDDGEVLRHPMVLVDGTYDGGSLSITAAPAGAAVSVTTHGNRFRCLADLRPGTNSLTITDNHGPFTLNLVHTPPTATDYRFKVWYVVPSDEANSPADPAWFAHFGLQAKLMQSWMAEDQLRAGNGRATFYPQLDASGQVDVGLLVVSQTRAQAEALGAGMYGEVWKQIPAASKNGRIKNLAFSSVAFNALAGGDLCYVGAYTGIHPDNAMGMMEALLSTRLGNDHALTYSTYTGVTLHELIHTLHNIWHDTSPNHIMGGGGYDISQYFTLTRSEADPTPHGEAGAGTLGKQRDLAAWNRYLMSADPRVYQDAAVVIDAGPQNLTATSAHPLAVFQYYIPNSAADLHVNLAGSPATTYNKDAGQARLELGGASSFNIMAVDTEGNMSYTTFTAQEQVTDISGNLTQNLDVVVGAGNSARLVSNTKTHWNSTTSVSDIDLGGYQFTIDNGGGNGQTYNGAITGPGILYLRGRDVDEIWFPDIRLGGTRANTPDSVILQAGTINLNKSPGVDALAGPITVATSVSTWGSRIRLNAGDQINDASVIDATTSKGFFHLLLNGFDETIAGLAIKTGHTVDTGAGGNLTVGSLTVGGTQFGPGTYTAGNSSFVTGSGSVIVFGGTGSAFDTWAQTHITELNAGADATATGDADDDGVNNLTEFALHGDPLDGADNGFHQGAGEDTDGDALKELTLTLAVRNGGGPPAFTGAPALSANVDGVTYSIEGSLDLAFPNMPVGETAPPTGLPVLPAGWEYRRFRLNGSNALTGSGFLRAKITEQNP